MADQTDHEIRALRGTPTGECGAIPDLTRSINLFAINTLIDAAGSAGGGADTLGVVASVRGMAQRLATLTRDLDVEATLIDAPAGLMTPPFPPQSQPV